MLQMDLGALSRMSTPTFTLINRTTSVQGWTEQIDEQELREQLGTMHVRCASPKKEMTWLAGTTFPYGRSRSSSRISWPAGRLRLPEYELTAPGRLSSS